MSIPKDDIPFPILLMVGFALFALVASAALKFVDPVIPDEDDCRAFGRAEDCWKDAPADQRPMDDRIRFHPVETPQRWGEVNSY